MENNELEQLFEAKRTAEDNRRRQKELTQMIEGLALQKAKTHVRPMWPVWTGAVAAGIALLLLTLPALFRTETVSPVQVAQTEVPVAVKEPPLLQQESTMPTKNKTYKKAIESVETIEAKEETEKTEPLESIQSNESIYSINTIESSPTETPVTPTPRRHRRTSTRMVIAPAATQHQPSEMGLLLADAFCTEEKQPIVLHTIKL